MRMRIAALMMLVLACTASAQSTVPQGNADALPIQATPVAEPPPAESVVAEMARLGAVNDESFAAARGRRLLRGGHSNAAILAHLARKAVPSAIARAVLPGDAETQLAAALVHARKRRIGPFRREVGEQEPDAARARALKERAAMARAGFPAGLADQALGMEPEAAQAFVEAARRDA